jgi:hypothetical protein
MKHCFNCGNELYSIWFELCKPCIINNLRNNLRNNFTHWTSENEKIDDFIQKKQLSINTPSEIVFEWIPYGQFSNIKEIIKGDFAAVYSANWNDGPLNYDHKNNEYIRDSDKKVALKYLYNSQNTINEVLNNKV